MRPLVLYHAVSAFCSAVRYFIFVRPSVRPSWLLLTRKPSLVCLILSLKQDAWLLAVSTSYRRVTTDFYLTHSLDSLTAITRGGPRLDARNSHTRWTVHTSRGSFWRTSRYFAHHFCLLFL